MLLIPIRLSGFYAGSTFGPYANKKHAHNYLMLLVLSEFFAPRTFGSYGSKKYVYNMKNPYASSYGLRK